MDEMRFSIELELRWQELPDNLFGTAVRVNNHSFLAL